MVVLKHERPPVKSSPIVLRWKSLIGFVTLITTVLLLSWMAKAGRGIPSGRPSGLEHGIEG